VFNYSQIDDAILFNEQFPPKEKCPKCNLVLPPGQGSTYPACCGAIVCGGCNNISFLVCISCGTLGAYDENEVLKQLKKRMHLGDAQAFNMMGVCHINGFGVKKDHEKAIELWTKGGELGCADSFRNIARLYDDDQGVGFNILKDGMAAILGDHYARHYLGWIESNDDERSMMHFRIAAKNGVRESLEVLRQKGRCQRVISTASFMITKYQSTKSRVNREILQQLLLRMVWAVTCRLAQRNLHNLNHRARKY
jgi:hypothetical protein